MRHRIVRSYALAATERKRCWSRSTTLRFAEKLVWFWAPTVRSDALPPHESLGFQSERWFAGALYQYDAASAGAIGRYGTVGCEL